jgi:4-amino-4-deoxy-L-arabinose transferase-like glycosyltransferase
MDFTQTEKPPLRQPDVEQLARHRGDLARLDARPWIGIACILALFIIAVVHLHPVNLFGLSEDDSIYFSSAKALAAGRGYILPSVPGTPAATKYPIFYPWILSWIWRLNPSFPANLMGAITVNVCFGMAFVIFTYLFLKRMKGIGESEALGITAYCALHPLVVYYSGQVISDVPFAALVLAAMLSAETAVAREAKFAAVVRCGVITGLSMLMRVFGVPVAAGILAAMIARRALRQSLVFSGCIAPFFAVVAWRAVFPTVTVPPVSGDSASSFGWIHTWTYYTSYLAAWKVAVPNIHVLGAMLKNNALTLFCQPAYYLLYPLFVRHNFFWPCLAAVVAATMLGGIVRQAVQNEWKPVHFVLPAYLAVMFFWNYPLPERFLIPFLPLFVAGIWLEIRNVWRLARCAITANQPVSEKAIAAALCLIIAAFGCAVTFNYVGGTRSLVAEQSRRRGELAVDKQAAYRWLAASTAPDARVIAYEDGAVYLYAGRAAIRPITFTTDAFYEPFRLNEQLEHLTDVARAIHADYWVFSDDDYSEEWPGVEIQGRALGGRFERALPTVYRSPNGRVRVHDLSCIQHPDIASCRLADGLLFPAPDNSSRNEIARR